MKWRRANAVGAILAGVLWIIATLTDWVASTRFVSHVSMLALVIAFVAAWRSDVPTPPA